MELLFEIEAVKMLHWFHLNVLGAFKAGYHSLDLAGTKAFQNWSDLIYLYGKKKKKSVL